MFLKLDSSFQRQIYMGGYSQTKEDRGFWNVKVVEIKIAHLKTVQLYFYECNVNLAIMVWLTSETFRLKTGNRML